MPPSALAGPCSRPSRGACAEGRARGNPRFGQRQAETIAATQTKAASNAGSSKARRELRSSSEVSLRRSRRELDPLPLLSPPPPKACFAIDTPNRTRAICDSTDQASGETVGARERPTTAATIATSTTAEGQDCRGVVTWSSVSAFGPCVNGVQKTRATGEAIPWPREDTVRGARLTMQICGTIRQTSRVTRRGE